MMEILIMLLAINRLANNIFGSSNRVTILRQDVSCLVFRILISLWVSEKKATSEPDRTKERINRKRIPIARTVVACGLMSRSTERLSKWNSFVKG